MVRLGIDAVCGVPGAVVRHVAAQEVVGLDRLVRAVLVDAPVGVILIERDWLIIIRVGEDTFEMYLRYRYRYMKGCISCIF